MDIKLLKIPCMCACSNSQSRTFLRSLQPPTELQQQLEGCQEGHLIFLWVPEKERLVGILTVAPKAADGSAGAAASKVLLELNPAQP